MLKLLVMLCIVLATLTLSPSVYALPIGLRSPDGRINVKVNLVGSSYGQGCAAYSIEFDEQEIVCESLLGLILKDDGLLLSNFVVVDSEKTYHNDNWEPVYGERSLVTDEYNQLEIVLKEDKTPSRLLKIEFRAYNAGVAFRYLLPEQKTLRNFTIASEFTQFNLPEGAMVYEEHGSEGDYSRVSPRDVKPNCESPLTIEYAHGKVACLLEANLYDYAMMRLSALRKDTDILRVVFADEVKGRTPFATPWRVFILGDKPGDLIENNYLVLNLNQKNQIKDTSWIKPGKIMREVTLSTQGAKTLVDFAKKHNIQYIAFDSGWYGPETDNKADATKVTLDPNRVGKGHQGLDLQEVISYANKHDIGVFVYVNRRALERQLDEILPIYARWGLKGIKFGFVQVGTQEMTKWLLDAVRKAADYQLLIDIHDAYRPTGFSRTYPNLLTQEGVQGNEHMPTATHNVTLPFVRFPAGAADYTICYYDKRLKTTHAHQMAATVVFYSPLQFLFWYDRPSDYRGEPEIEFFEHVPTTWDDTKVLCGEIGSFVSIARRKGSEWHVGTMTNENPRTVELTLDFLPPDEKYIAHVYSDGPRNGVKIERFVVDASTVMQAELAGSGGQAMRLCPATNEELGIYPQYNQEH
ncbi:MAG: glycoside hydrolase family 97 protein [Limnochordia bacterium]|nr:glycoside hydrolase family 97 protein [Limnochordia bacterium]